MIKGIICFETEWDVRSKNTLNTEPLLMFLESYYPGLECIHRNIVTKDQLKYYFKQFGIKKYEDYAIYFSIHGEKGIIKLEGEPKDEQLVAISELVELGNNSFFNNKIVHFSSCRTMIGNGIENFLEISGAKVVSGYSKYVDMTKSAICDLTYFDTILKMKQLATVKKKMASYDIAQELGFKIGIK